MLFKAQVLETALKLKAKLPYQEYVVDGIQNHQDGLGILHMEKIQNGLQTPTLHQLHHLIYCAPTGVVGYGPNGFPLSLEVTLPGAVLGLGHKSKLNLTPVTS